MRNLVILLILGILMINGLSAVGISQESIKYKTISINFSKPKIIDEKEYVKVNFIETNSFLIKQNKPLIPCYIETFTFPIGTKINGVSCVVKGISKQTLTKYIIPSPEPVSGDYSINNGIIHKSPVKYGDDPYPNSWYTYDVGSGIYNNERCIVVKVQVFPFQYYPSEGMIKCVNNIEIKVEYKKPVKSTKCNDNYDFIILAPSEFSNELASLVTHKINRGISTIFVSLTDIYNGVYFPTTGRDDQEKIKYFIKNAIENWNTEFVLLVGGISKFPARETHINNEGDDEIFLSELYYADIYNDTSGFCSWDSNNNDVFGEFNWTDSNNYDDVDLYPDVYLGRLACVNENEVITSVNKIKKYENDEVYKEHWFNDLVVIGGDHYPGDKNAVDEGEFVNKIIMGIMGGFVPKRIWDSNGRLSGIIPNGVTEINDAIDAGCGFIDFSGHGNTNVWATHAHEDEDKWIPTPNGYYLNKRVQERTNRDELPIVIIGACSTCKYNKDFDCFGWSFILNDNGGGIAVCGASGLDWFYAGEYVSEKGFERICIDAFRAYYLDSAMSFGEIWEGAISRYIYPKMDSLDYKTVEEWQPFGDPTLAIRGDSQPPTKPETPSGPQSGETGTKYTYSTSSTDPDEDQIFYLFDWGDKTTSGWVGPFSSGSTGSASHIWNKDGTFEVKVIAKDENGVISSWSDPLEINMPRNKEITNTMFFNFINRFIDLLPILKILC